MIEGDFVWILAKWKDLDAIDIYSIVKLRVDVFIVEQNCIYSEFDGCDILPDSFHLICKTKSSNAVVAYLRILAPFESGYGIRTRIGRIIVDSSMRGSGLSYKLMQEGISHCKQKFPESSIQISAQAHLIRFYEKCGFHTTGQEYLEDDIPHICMLLDI
mmetsp:Transcript_2426/g.4242  ORF Transcript_2426/g.4242 Transcript_2426/m.4242 type:complete len:159 (-) Transcript_2426:69-545(-)